jgi:hypothetical protein
MGPSRPDVPEDSTLQRTHDEVAAAIAAAEESSRPNSNGAASAVDAPADVPPASTPTAQGDPGEASPQ